MTTTASTSTLRNGIDTAQVYGTLDVLKAQPEAARFEFRVSNRWIDGTHSRSTIHGFWGAGANPAELLLHALAGCLTLTIVNVAAARKVVLHEVSSALTGVLDARGAVGIDDSYRNGFERIEIAFSIRGDASAEKLQEVVERAKSRSVVYDMVTNGVPVAVTADVS